MSPVCIRPLRVYACFIDGRPFSTSFVRPQGVSPPMAEALLNRRFESWVDGLAPGSFAQGRVTETRVIDYDGSGV